MVDALFHHHIYVAHLKDTQSTKVNKLKDKRPKKKTQKYTVNM